MSYGAPKLFFSREAPAIRPSRGIETKVWHIFGVSERGPVGVATLLTGWESFKKTFGSFLSAYATPLQVYRAMKGKANKRIYFTRITHFSDVDDPTTTAAVKATATLQTAAAVATSGYVLGTIAEPFDMAVNDTIHVVTDAASGTMTLAATRAARASTDGETYNLENGWTLTVKIDAEAVAQTITFLAAEVVDIDAVTAQEAVNIINSQIVGAHASLSGAGLDHVTITSDTYGLDSWVEVTGGLANGAFNFNVAAIQGTGNVGNIDAVGIDDLKTGIELACAGVTVSNVGGYCKILRNATGSTKTVQVHSDSTGADEVGLDTATHAGTDGTPVDTLQVDAKSPGTWGNSVSVIPQAATDGTAAKFDLCIYYADALVERHRNLTIGSANVAAANYCDRVILRDSSYITCTDKLAAVASPLNIPATAVETDLTTGNDGISALAVADYKGKAGMRAIEIVSEPKMNQYCPDLTAMADQKDLVDYGESARLFTLIDPPANTIATAFVAALNAAGLIEYSELAATYFAPWVKIANPDTDTYGADDTITCAPGGGIIAAMLTQDGKLGGVHEAAAGTELGLMGDVVGLSTTEADDPSIRDYLYDNLVNTIHRSKTGLYYIDGTRTLKSQGSFPTVGETRGVLYIEKTLDAALEWIVNRNITDRLFRRIYDQIYLFLLGEMANDAFSTRDASTAFYIDMSAELNPASEKYQGRIHIKIGLAKSRPLDHGFIVITKDVRAVAEEILKSA